MEMDHISSLHFYSQTITIYSLTELSVVLTTAFPEIRVVIQMHYFLQQFLPVRQLF